MDVERLEDKYGIFSSFSWQREIETNKLVCRYEMNTVLIMILDEEDTAS